MTMVTVMTMPTPTGENIVTIVITVMERGCFAGKNCLKTHT